MSQVEKTKSNLVKCRCKLCPTYPLLCLAKAAPQMTKVFLTPDGPAKEKHVESLFCAYEPSICIKKGKGCLCPKCSVYKKYSLDRQYHCLSK